ncbi:MAG TPA: hypothetical protein VF714_04355, partial [Jatrophihabitans sp.]
VLSYQGILWSVSCPSTSFCMTADGSNTYTYDGSAWSAPMQLTHDPDPNVGPALVSCTSASFCLAVPRGRGGSSSWAWDGATWTAHAVPTEAGFSDLSCVSPTFCLGTVADYYAGDNRAYTFNGSGWSGGVPVNSHGWITGVSCATTSFCVIANEHGDVFVFNGTTWSAASHLTDAEIYAVSCPSTTFCMAPDGRGVSHAYNGTAWSSQPLPAMGVNAVSCSSSAFCAARNGEAVMTFDGTSWGPSSTLERLDTSWTHGAISCPAAKTCVVVDHAGQAFYTGAVTPG